MPKEAVPGPTRVGFVLGVATNLSMYWLEENICLPKIRLSDAPTRIDVVSSNDPEYTPVLESPVLAIVG